MTWAYTVAYNEATIIPYWVRHHITFCEKVIVYADPECDDDTAALAEREGAEVRGSFSSPLNDYAFAAFANAQWHEATGKTDWVTWLDADEFIYHPRPLERLAELKALGITLPRLEYYVMSSPRPPTHKGQIYALPEFRRGINCEGKQAPLFDPNAVNVKWSVGKHYAAITGSVRHDNHPGEPFKMLHYRWLGEQYLQERDARNYARMPEALVSTGHGFHCSPEFVGPYDPRWTGPSPYEAQECLEMTA